MKDTATTAVDPSCEHVAAQPRTRSRAARFLGLMVLGIVAAAACAPPDTTDEPPTGYILYSNCLGTCSVATRFDVSIPAATTSTAGSKTTYSGRLKVRWPADPKQGYQGGIYDGFTAVVVVDNDDASQSTITVTQDRSWSNVMGLGEVSTPANTLTFTGTYDPSRATNQKWSLHMKGAVTLSAGQRSFWGILTPDAAQLDVDLDGRAPATAVMVGSDTPNAPPAFQPLSLVFADPTQAELTRFPKGMVAFTPDGGTVHDVVIPGSGTHFSAAGTGTPLSFMVGTFDPQARTMSGNGFVGDVAPDGRAIKSASWDLSVTTDAVIATNRFRGTGTYLSLDGPSTWNQTLQSGCGACWRHETRVADFQLTGTGLTAQWLVIVTERTPTGITETTTVENVAGLLNGFPVDLASGPVTFVNGTLTSASLELLSNLSVGGVLAYLRGSVLAITFGPDLSFTIEGSARFKFTDGSELRVGGRLKLSLAGPGIVRLDLLGGAQLLLDGSVSGEAEAIATGSITLNLVTGNIDASLQTAAAGLLTTADGLLAFDGGLNVTAQVRPGPVFTATLNGRAAVWLADLTSRTQVRGAARATLDGSGKIDIEFLGDAKAVLSGDIEGTAAAAVTGTATVDIDRGPRVDADLRVAADARLTVEGTGLSFGANARITTTVNAAVSPASVNGTIVGALRAELSDGPGAATVNGNVTSTFTNTTLRADLAADATFSIAGESGGNGSAAVSGNVEVSLPTQVATIDLNLDGAVTAGSGLWSLAAGTDITGSIDGGAQTWQLAVSGRATVRAALANSKARMSGTFSGSWTPDQLAVTFAANGSLTFDGGDTTATADGTASLDFATGKTTLDVATTASASLRYGAAQARGTGVITLAGTIDPTTTPSTVNVTVNGRLALGLTDSGVSLDATADATGTLAIDATGNEQLDFDLTADGQVSFDQPGAAAINAAATGRVLIDIASATLTADIQTKAGATMSLANGRLLVDGGVHLTGTVTADSVDIALEGSAQAKLTDSDTAMVGRLLFTASISDDQIAFTALSGSTLDVDGPDASVAGAVTGTVGYTPSSGVLDLDLTASGDLELTGSHLTVGAARLTGTVETAGGSPQVALSLTGDLSGSVGLGDAAVGFTGSATAAITNSGINGAIAGAGTVTWSDGEADLAAGGTFGVAFATNRGTFALTTAAGATLRAQGTITVSGGAELRGAVTVVPATGDAEPSYAASVDLSGNLSASWQSDPGNAGSVTASVGAGVDGRIGTDRVELAFTGAGTLAVGTDTAALSSTGNLVIDFNDATFAIDAAFAGNASLGLYGGRLSVGAGGTIAVQAGWAGSLGAPSVQLTGATLDARFQNGTAAARIEGTVDALLQGPELAVTLTASASANFGSGTVDLIAGGTVTLNLGTNVVAIDVEVSGGGSFGDAAVNVEGSRVTGTIDFNPDPAVATLSIAASKITVDATIAGVTVRAEASIDGTVSTSDPSTLNVTGNAKLTLGGSTMDLAASGSFTIDPTAKTVTVDLTAAGGAAIREAGTRIDLGASGARFTGTLLDWSRADYRSDLQLTGLTLTANVSLNGVAGTVAANASARFDGSKLVVTTAANGALTLGDQSATITAGGTVTADLAAKEATLELTTAANAALTFGGTAVTVDLDGAQITGTALDWSVDPVAVDMRISRANVTAKATIAGFETKLTADATGTFNGRILAIDVTGNAKIKLAGSGDATLDATADVVVDIEAKRVTVDATVNGDATASFGGTSAKVRLKDGTKVTGTVVDWSGPAVTMALDLTNAVASASAVTAGGQTISGTVTASGSFDGNTFSLRGDADIAVKWGPNGGADLEAREVELTVDLPASTATLDALVKGTAQQEFADGRLVLDLDGGHLVATIDYGVSPIQATVQLPSAHMSALLGTDSGYARVEADVAIGGTQDQLQLTFTGYAWVDMAGQRAALEAGGRIDLDVPAKRATLAAAMQANAALDFEKSGQGALAVRNATIAGLLADWNGALQTNLGFSGDITAVGLVGSGVGLNAMGAITGGFNGDVLSLTYGGQINAVFGDGAATLSTPASTVAVDLKNKNVYVNIVASVVGGVELAGKAVALAGGNAVIEGIAVNFADGTNLLPNISGYIEAVAEVRFGSPGSYAGRATGNARAVLTNNVLSVELLAGANIQLGSGSAAASAAAAAVIDLKSLTAAIDVRVAAGANLQVLQGLGLRGGVRVSGGVAFGGSTPVFDLRINGAAQIDANLGGPGGPGGAAVARVVAVFAGTIQGQVLRLGLVTNAGQSVLVLGDAQSNIAGAAVVVADLGTMSANLDARIDALPIFGPNAGTFDAGAQLRLAYANGQWALRVDGAFNGDFTVGDTAMNVKARASGILINGRFFQVALAAGGRVQWEKKPGVNPPEFESEATIDAVALAIGDLQQKTAVVDLLSRGQVKLGKLAGGFEAKWALARITGTVNWGAAAYDLNVTIRNAEVSTQDPEISVTTVGITTAKLTNGKWSGQLLGQVQVKTGKLKVAGNIAANVQGAIDARAEYDFRQKRAALNVTFNGNIALDNVPAIGKSAIVAKNLKIAANGPVNNLAGWNGTASGDLDISLQPNLPAVGVAKVRTTFTFAGQYKGKKITTNIQNGKLDVDAAAIGAGANLDGVNSTVVVDLGLSKATFDLRVQAASTIKIAANTVTLRNARVDGNVTWAPALNGNVNFRAFLDADLTAPVGGVNVGGQLRNVTIQGNVTPKGLSLGILGGQLLIADGNAQIQGNGTVDVDFNKKTASFRLATMGVANMTVGGGHLQLRGGLKTDGTIAYGGLLPFWNVNLEGNLDRGNFDVADAAGAELAAVQATFGFKGNLFGPLLTLNANGQGSFKAGPYTAKTTVASTKLTLLFLNPIDPTFTFNADLDGDLAMGTTLKLKTGLNITGSGTLAKAKFKFKGGLSVDFTTDGVTGKIDPCRIDGELVREAAPAKLTMTLNVLPGCKFKAFDGPGGTLEARLKIDFLTKRLDLTYARVTAPAGGVAIAMSGDSKVGIGGDVTMSGHVALEPVGTEPVAKLNITGKFQVNLKTTKYTADFAGNVTIDAEWKNPFADIVVVLGSDATALFLNATDPSVATGRITAKGTFKIAPKAKRVTFDNVELGASGAGMQWRAGAFPLPVDARILTLTASTTINGSAVWNNLPNSVDLQLGLKLKASYIPTILGGPSHTLELDASGAVKGDNGLIRLSGSAKAKLTFIEMSGGTATIDTTFNGYIDVDQESYQVVLDRFTIEGNAGPITSLKVDLTGPVTVQGDFAGLLTIGHQGGSMSLRASAGTTVGATAVNAAAKLDANVDPGVLRLVVPGGTPNVNLIGRTTTLRLDGTGGSYASFVPSGFRLTSNATPKGTAFTFGPTSGSFDSGSLAAYGVSGMSGTLSSTAGIFTMEPWDLRASGQLSAKVGRIKIPLLNIPPVTVYGGVSSVTGTVGLSLSSARWTNVNGSGAAGAFVPPVALVPLDYNSARGFFTFAGGFSICGRASGLATSPLLGVFNPLSFDLWVGESGLCGAPPPPVKVTISGKVTLDGSAVPNPVVFGLGLGCNGRFQGNSDGTYSLQATTGEVCVLRVDAPDNGEPSFLTKDFRPVPGANVPNTDFAFTWKYPTAFDDTYSTPRATALVVASTNGVLKNDQGKTITVKTWGTPQHGTLSATNPNGAFTYTPNATYTGTDRFPYTIKDERGKEATAYIIITISCPPGVDCDPPPPPPTTTTTTAPVTTTTTPVTTTTTPGGTTTTTAPVTTTTTPGGTTTTTIPGGTTTTTAPVTTTTTPGGTTTTIDVTTTTTTGVTTTGVTTTIDVTTTTGGVTTTTCAPATTTLPPTTTIVEVPATVIETTIVDEPTTSVPAPTTTIAGPCGSTTTTPTTTTPSTTIVVPTTAPLTIFGAPVAFRSIVDPTESPLGWVVWFVGLVFLGRFLLARRLRQRGDR